MFLVNNRANYQETECKITTASLSNYEAFMNKSDAIVSEELVLHQSKLETSAS